MEIAILGSCVTRDAFELKKGSIRSDRYFARSSLASVFAQPATFEIELGKINSKFQRSMVENDLNKGFAAFLCESLFDLLIYDPIDERFSLLHNQSTGEICTLSGEFQLTGFQVPNHFQIVKSGSEDFFVLWEKGWAKLVETLKNRKLLHALRINRVMWAAETYDHESFLPAFSTQTISSANAFLRKIYRRMERDISSVQFFTFPPEILVGDSNHIWGKSPFHYIPQYSQMLMQKVNESCCERESVEFDVVAIREQQTVMAKITLVSALPNAKFAFYLIIDGKREDIRNYSPDCQASFEVNSECVSVEIMGFVLHNSERAYKRVPVPSRR